jgi:phosphonopyruvate decarboxylase
MSAKATVERRAFVARLMGGIPDALVVTGLGSPAYDVFAAGDRDANFYLWGAMGGATPMGLGLALAQPGRSVVVITGDGEMLMGMGSLATVGAQRPGNLTIVVLDNGHYGETGMQPSHTSLGTSLVAVAKGCGIEDAFSVDRLEGADDVAQRVNARGGTAVAVVTIAVEEPPRALPARDGVYLKNRFREHLGLAPF